jgi:hypothetical protein
LKHGKGFWRSGKGNHLSTYEGEYFMDKKHGFGLFRWSSGNIYKGTYCDDERHGYGEMMWTDRSKYVGEWRRGI